MLRTHFTSQSKRDRCGSRRASTRTGYVVVAVMMVIPPTDRASRQIPLGAEAPNGSSGMCAGPSGGPSGGMLPTKRCTLIAGDERAGRGLLRLLALKNAAVPRLAAEVSGSAPG